MLQEKSFAPVMPAVKTPPSNSAPGGSSSREETAKALYQESLAKLLAESKREDAALKEIGRRKEMKLSPVVIEHRKQGINTRLHAFRLMLVHPTMKEYVRDVRFCIESMEEQLEIIEEELE